MPSTNGGFITNVLAKCSLREFTLHSPRVHNDDDRVTIIGWGKSTAADGGIFVDLTPNGFSSVSPSLWGDPYAALGEGKLFPMSQERSPSFPTFVAYGPRMCADHFGEFQLRCQLFCSRE